MKPDSKKHRELIVEAQNYIWSHAETGYKEWQTHKYMKDAFEKLGYEVTEAGNVPGFYTVIDTGREGPELLVLAELDSLICFDHPDANKETGAVHCCGHSAQCAAMVGIAAGLKEEGALDGLSGRIRLCLVPAEELIEIEYRNELKKQGVIKYFGGKPEFLSRGYFDSVDLAFMIHTSAGGVFATRTGSNGCVAKKIIYKGKSAHAGGSPWNGRNALYAATAGINAANALRETFKEDDMIRFHPILTAGGSAVNAIPETAVLESYVRGATFDAILSANKNINRALVSGALAIGCDVEIVDNPGYAPLNNDRGMINTYLDAVKELGYDATVYETRTPSSTDMGDLSVVMPVVHPYCPGASGTSHGADYYINNPDLACVTSADLQLIMINLLLANGAERAKEIVGNFTPLYSKEEYLKLMDSIASEGSRIEYTETEAKIRL